MSSTNSINNWFFTHRDVIVTYYEWKQQNENKIFDSLVHLVSCAKLNFLASPRFGTVREFLLMFRSPTFRASSWRILLRSLCASLLLTRVIVNRSIFLILVSCASLEFFIRNLLFLSYLKSSRQHFHCSQENLSLHSFVELFS